MWQGVKLEYTGMGRHIVPAPSAFARRQLGAWSSRPCLGSKFLEVPASKGSQQSAPPRQEVLSPLAPSL